MDHHYLLETRPINVRRGESGGERKGGPLGSPASCSSGLHVGETRPPPTPRATLKALPATHPPPSPLHGWNGSRIGYGLGLPRSSYCALSCPVYNGTVK